MSRSFATPIVAERAPKGDCPHGVPWNARAVWDNDSQCYRRPCDPCNADWDKANNRYPDAGYPHYD